MNLSCKLWFLFSFDQFLDRIRIILDYSSLCLGAIADATFVRTSYMYLNIFSVRILNCKINLLINHLLITEQINKTIYDYLFNYPIKCL